MAHILIRGPLLTQSGYGVHSRQIFRWAHSRGHTVNSQLLPWGITPWFTNLNYLDGLVGKIMQTSGELRSHPDISFQIQLPNEWDSSAAKKNIGVTAAVETDRCNPEWVSHCASMDHVVVPSEFTKKVLTNTGHSGENLSVITECYYDHCTSDMKHLDFLSDIPTKFNFLLFGQVTGSPENDRKNTFNAVKWFCEEFQGKQVGLIIKTNMGTNSIMDRRATHAALKQFLDNIHTEKQKPRIYLLHGYLSPGEVASLYQSDRVRCLISTTRGEGFGLPLLEAAAAKLPVIATNWSGHLDFLNRGKWLPVEYSLQQIPKSRIDGQIFVEGSQWAEPDEKSFKLRLKKFYKSGGVPSAWTEKMAQEMQSHHSFEKVCELYDSLIERI